MFSDTSAEMHPLVSSNPYDEELPIISQYAQEVLDYSSSYGSHGTISYSAVNICGRPCKYPSYGDFAECFSLRHYGPVSETEFSPNDVQYSVTFHDYIVIQFEHYVLPTEIKIFETYNPGAVVRIYAYLWSEKRWEVLWEDFPVMVEKKSREFCPRIKKVRVPTRVLRIEFNCSLVDYYIGIDAVLLSGLKPRCPISRHVPESQIIMGIIQQKLETVKFKAQVPDNEIIEVFLKHDLDKFVENLGIKDPPEKAPRRKCEKSFADIPDEVLFQIMSYLDLPSLFNCSAVCQKFNRITKDPLLYVEVNLKRYWHMVDHQLMFSLMERCQQIKKFDLSCCNIAVEDFGAFLHFHGPSLTHLRLNHVTFLNRMALKSISYKCVQLEELQLQNYRCMPQDRDFSNLTLLTSLVVLNVSRTAIDTTQLIQLLRENNQLEHLNISYNSQVAVDQVCLTLASYNKKIKILDFWKCHNLTTHGLRMLVDCPDLEILNFGWNLREESVITVPFKELIESCPNIRKMILAAVRGIAERDLNNIAVYCRNLEHLDLMGIVGVTSDAIHTVLRDCPRLKVMDVSFCDNLDDVTLFKWSNDYNVCIKRSEIPKEY